MVVIQTMRSSLAKMYFLWLQINETRLWGRKLLWILIQPQVFKPLVTREFIKWLTTQVWLIIKEGKQNFNGRKVGDCCQKHFGELDALDNKSNQQG